MHKNPVSMGCFGKLPKLEAKDFDMIIIIIDKGLSSTLRIVSWPVGA
jgi:hypothetical protein